MKFTTDLERYFFACACVQKAENMIQFCDQMRCDKNLPNNVRKNWDEDYFKYVKRYNFWSKVCHHFEHAMNDFSQHTRINMSILVG